MGGERSTGTKRVSLRDVARLAGVSTATASRVLAGSDHPVSANTRLAVLSAADQLSFQPNRLARALVTARSGVVGVIVHDISDPYFGDIVRGLEDGLGPEDYRIVVSSSDRDPAKELDYLNALIQQQVDGIVLAASSLTDRSYEDEVVETVSRFRKQGGSIVLLSDHVVRGPRVIFANLEATKDMVSYLVGKGHRRIAYLAGPGNLSVAAARLEGYRLGLRTANIEFDDTLIEDGEFTIEGGGAAAVRLLESSQFTALFAANDLMAIGATRALLDQNVDIPSEISVAGFDDIVLAEYGPIPLTTVRMPTHEIGLRGARMMLALLRGEEPPDERLEGSIVCRKSVASIGD